MDGTLPAPLTLTVRRVGESLALTLPDDLARRLRVAEGGELYVTETPTGVTVSAFTPDEQEQLRLGREFMAKYRRTFAALAK